MASASTTAVITPTLGVVGGQKSTLLTVILFFIDSIAVVGGYSCTYRYRYKLSITIICVLKQATYEPFFS